MRCFDIFSLQGKNTWKDKTFPICFKNCEHITVIQTLADFILIYFNVVV